MKRNLCLIVTSILLLLPFFHIASAQQSHSTPQTQPHQVTVKPPTHEYYDDDWVAYTAQRIKIVGGQLHLVKIGGNPQMTASIKATYHLNADEFVYTVKEGDHIQVMIMDYGLTLWVGELPVGTEVVAKKSTGKITVTLTCGNWTRGCVPLPGCQPHALEKIAGPVTDEQGFSVTTWTDGCKLTIIKTKETVTPGKDKEVVREVCPPNAWFILDELGSHGLDVQRGQKIQIAQAKKMKKFKIGQDLKETTKTAIVATAGQQFGQDFFQSQATIVQVLAECANQLHLRIMALVLEKDGWHWKEFLIGVVVGVAVYAVIDSLVDHDDREAINPAKSGIRRRVLVPPGTSTVTDTALRRSGVDRVINP